MYWSTDSADADLATLDMGEGSNAVQTITPSGVTAFTLSFDGETTISIDGDAAADEIQSALVLLDAIGNNDVAVTPIAVGGWTVTFVGNMAGMPQPLMTATTSTGTVTVDTTTIGTQRVNRLDGIEQAILRGGDGDDLLDASGFNGAVALFGGGGNDVLIGAQGEDDLDGGLGNDRLIGGVGDILDGNEDVDTVVLSGDTNITITNATALIGTGTADLISIEFAELIGGARTTRCRPRRSRH